MLRLPAARGLRSAFARRDANRFSGFVVDRDDLDCRFAIEILVDGYPIQIVRADAAVDELKIGDGHFGFSCHLDDAILNASTVVEARLANIGTPVGEPIVLAEPLAATADWAQESRVRWLGGLRFSGWTAMLGGNVQVLVDGTLVSRVRASTWCHTGTSEQDARAVRAFDFHLPPRFADGGVHRLAVVDEAGKSQGGDPIVFIAYADGLREAFVGKGVSEQDRIRAEMLERLMPMSVPFSQYQTWRDALPAVPATASTLRASVILVGAGGSDDSVETLQEQSGIEWTAAALPATADATGFPVELAQAFLRREGTDSDFIVFALAGTSFSAFALQRFAAAFDQFHDARAAYCDVEIQSPEGSIWPLAFPAFDYERMLEQGYGAYVFALRRSVAERALARGASNLYRVFNCLLDRNDAAPCSDFVHIPVPLATLPAFDRTAATAALATATRSHLQESGIAGEVAPSRGSSLPAVRVARKSASGRTTIIVPTRNRRTLLQGCIDSIEPAIKRAQAELLIVDNDSADVDTLEYLRDLERDDATVLRVPGEFNFPRLINRAAEVAQGDILCLLNNDVKAFDECWLEEMLGRLAAEDVGAVGALLVWPSGVVQHGGVVLGPSFAATHAFNDRVNTDNGYGDLLVVAHECSAVTAACLVTRRQDYLGAGGMDEIRFPVNFNDVDYCLKLRALGKRIVFTPHAKLAHLESASRGSKTRPNQEERFERELHNLRSKWGHVLAADPYYSPVLSLDPIPFSALAWPIRALESRLNVSPNPISIPAGF